MVLLIYARGRVLTGPITCFAVVSEEAMRDVSAPEL